MSRPLARALAVLRRMDEPMYVLETAALLLRRMYSARPFFFARNTEELVRAAVYAAKRLHGLPAGDPGTRRLGVIYSYTGVGPRVSPRARDRDVAGEIWRAVEAMGLPHGLGVAAYRVYSENRFFFSTRTSRVAAALALLHARAALMMGDDAGRLARFYGVSREYLVIARKGMGSVHYVLPCLGISVSWDGYGSPPVREAVEKNTCLRIQGVEVARHRFETVSIARCRPDPGACRANGH